MADQDYPGNSHVQKKAAETPKKDIKQIVDTADVSVVKPSPVKRFKSTFVKASLKSIAAGILTEVLIPSVTDMMYNSGRNALDRAFYNGRNPRASGPTATQSVMTQAINYTKGAQAMANSGPAMSKEARARHDFSGLAFRERHQAQSILDQMFAVLGKYDVISVADLYIMVGMTPDAPDNRFGWVSLAGAGVRHTGAGYTLDLPATQQLH